MLFRCGVIGLGRIGCEFIDNHAKAYRDCKDTALSFLWDIDQIKTDAWCDFYGIKNDVELDIISICTPPETHRQIVEQWSHDVRGIYCEKPIATTLEDADAMIELCHKRHIILQVNHQRRFGNPKFLFSRGILNTGTHMFDLLRMYFGEIRLEGNQVITPNGLHIDIFELYGEEPYFEFVMPNQSDLILKGVEHLVECIKQGKQSISSGIEAREDLRLCLDFKEHQ